MARESSLWQWLQRRVKLVDKLHLCRVENAVEAGTPDVEGCYQGLAFHLELKSEERPARAETPVRFKIRSSQVLWLRKRWRCGGNCWWYLQVGEGFHAARYLIPGYLGMQLLDGVTEEWLLIHSVLAPDHDDISDLLHAVDRRHSEL